MDRRGEMWLAAPPEETPESAHLSQPRQRAVEALRHIRDLARAEEEEAVQSIPNDRERVDHDGDLRSWIGDSVRFGRRGSHGV
jgi:hypothetical protein